jgi:hypothetical protein
MLTDHGHIAATGAMGTLHSADQDDPALRYPGYLGEAFRPETGTLVIYGIHREFHSENLVTDPNGVIEGFILASQHLQKSETPDDTDLERYIRAHRAMYEIGLSGGWRVSSHLKEAMPACGLSFDRHGVSGIAYVNVSCCQVPELQKNGNDDTRRKNWLKKSCSAAHPVAEVVKLLRPAIVLCASSPGYASLAKAHVGGSLATVFYNQNGGYLERPIDFPDGQVVPTGARRAVWTAALRKQAARAELR